MRRKRDRQTDRDYGIANGFYGDITLLRDGKGEKGALNCIRETVTTLTENKFN